MECKALWLRESLPDTEYAIFENNEELASTKTGKNPTTFGIISDLMTKLIPKSNIERTITSNESLGKIIISTGNDPRFQTCSDKSFEIRRDGKIIEEAKNRTDYILPSDSEDELKYSIEELKMPKHIIFNGGRDFKIGEHVYFNFLHASNSESNIVEIKDVGNNGEVVDYEIKTKKSLFFSEPLQFSVLPLWNYIDNYFGNFSESDFDSEHIYIQKSNTKFTLKITGNSGSGILQVNEENISNKINFNKDLETTAKILVESINNESNSYFAKHVENNIIKIYTEKLFFNKPSVKFDQKESDLNIDVKPEIEIEITGSSGSGIIEVNGEEISEEISFEDNIIKTSQKFIESINNKNNSYYAEHVENNVIKIYNRDIFFDPDIKINSNNLSIKNTKKYVHNEKIYNLYKVNLNGKKIWTSEHYERINVVKVDSSNNVYTGSKGNIIRKLDSSGNEIWQFTGHTGDIQSLALDNEGNLYSGSSDKSIRKLNTENGEEEWNYTGHEENVLTLFVDNSNNVYSGSFDNTVRKLNADGNEIWRYTGHTSSVQSVVVDGSGNVYSGSADNTVRKLDSNGNEQWQFTGHTSSIQTLALDNEENLYSGSKDKTIRKIDLQGNEIWKNTVHENTVNLLGIYNNFLISGSSGLLTKLNRNNGEEQWIEAEHNDTINFIDSDRNGNIISASSDKTVKKIGLSGKENWTYTGHTSEVKSLALDEDNNIYSASFDKTVRKIDDQGNEKWLFENDSNINVVRVNGFGNIYLGDVNGKIKKLNKDGDEIWSISGNSDWITSLDVDIYGNAYSGGKNGIIQKVIESDNATEPEIEWNFSEHGHGLVSIVVDDNTSLFNDRVNIFSLDSNGTIKKIDLNGNEISSKETNADLIFNDGFDNIYFVEKNKIKRIDSNMSNEDTIKTFNESINGMTIKLTKSKLAFYVAFENKIKKLTSTKNRDIFPLKNIQSSIDGKGFQIKLNLELGRLNLKNTWPGRYIQDFDVEINGGNPEEKASINNKVETENQEGEAPAIISLDNPGKGYKNPRDVEINIKNITSK